MCLAYTRDARAACRVLGSLYLFPGVTFIVSASQAECEMLHGEFTVRIR